MSVAVEISDRVDQRTLVQEGALFVLGAALPWLPILSVRVGVFSGDWWLRNSPVALVGAIAVIFVIAVAPRLRTIGFGVGAGIYSVFLFGSAVLPA